LILTKILRKSKRKSKSKSKSKSPNWEKTRASKAVTTRAIMLLTKNLLNLISHQKKIGNYQCKCLMMSHFPNLESSILTTPLRMNHLMVSKIITREKPIKQTISINVLMIIR